MSKKFIWKVWLRQNLLTKDVENDYLAEVDTAGKTLHNADIAQAIKDEGSELQYETLLDILNRGDRIRRERIQQGYSIQTGVSHIAPRVLGNWFGATAHFDHAIHKLTCDMSPSSELHAAFEEIGIEVLGVKDSGARIGLITDVTTGKTNGEITVDGDLIVDGYKIKIAPADDPDTGVFFVSAAKGETPLTRHLTQNDPKRIIVRVPELSAGNYKLKIVTRYTGSTLLKEPRTIVSEETLTVKE